MIVAPVATPLKTDTQLAKESVWLPPGMWIEWFTGTELQGPAKVDRTFALEEIPVYVKAGAVIPMAPKMRSTSEKPVDPLIVTIFPGPSGEARLYEDASNTIGYTGSEFAWTTIRQSNQQTIEILPVEGSYPAMPQKRGYEIRLVNTLPPASSTYPWRYDGTTLTTIVSVPPQSVHRRVEVIVHAPPAPPALVSGVRGELARLRTAMSILNTSWPDGWSPDILVEAAQAGRRMTLRPDTAAAELQKLQHDMPAIVQAIQKMDVDCRTVALALNHLGRPTTCVAAPVPPPTTP